MTDQPTIFEALVNARQQIGGVGKHQKNKDPRGGYDFRGIDAVVNAAAPVLANNGINIVPSRIIESSSGQIIYGSKNNKSQTARIVIEYIVFGPAGDSFTIQAVGEAFDSGDKATPKAHAVAWRTALIQVLMLSTDEPDPDAETFDGNTGEYTNVDWAAEAFELSGGNRKVVLDALRALSYSGEWPEQGDQIWERVVVFLRSAQSEGERS